ncbi:hypothetical protein HanHA89_Chr16g0641561 [Helianthus annuus]|nr:hypothetical protein HanHA89_Chr16g0641561 [Helianthus annuus]
MLVDQLDIPLLLQILKICLQQRSLLLLQDIPTEQQSMLSPINTNVFSPKNTFTICCKLLLAFHHRGEAWIQYLQREKNQQLRSLSSRDLGTNSPFSVM